MSAESRCIERNSAAMKMKTTRGSCCTHTADEYCRRALRSIPARLPASKLELETVGRFRVALPVPKARIVLFYVVIGL